MAGPPAVERNDIQLFTLSKLSGHASARVGWAFVGTKNSNFIFCRRMRMKTWNSNRKFVRVYPKKKKGPKTSKY
jgi:hypothetical protein